VEDLARRREGEAAGTSERGRDVLDNPPVLSRLAGAVDRLVDFDDTALHLRDRAFVLLLEAAGQDDVGVARRVVEEKVDGGVELQFLEGALNERAVGQRHLWVEADRQQAPDLAGLDFSEQL